MQMIEGKYPKIHCLSCKISVNLISINYSKKNG